MMEKIKGGIAAPKGFLASSLNCGIKKYRLDVALLFSDTPATAFAVFTKNEVKAAPVIVSRKYIKKHIARAIIVNSGNANCCTGPAGIKDAERMSSFVAAKIKRPKNEVLVASTGVIGKPLQIRLIEKAVPALIKGLSNKGGRAFARAIMTTDKFPKEEAVKIRIGNEAVRIAGTAKGAGMINPNMATMLAFITTDAAIEKGALNSAFRNAVEKSFNSISVDGATSTNDSVFIMANGLAGNKKISAGSAGYKKFCGALDYVTEGLAKKIVLDGEGATKFIKITVKNAGGPKDAKAVAASVANNALFKVSVYGEDPNWGRIAAAAGASGAKVILRKLDIYIGARKVLEGGSAVKADKEALRKIYKNREIAITIDLKLGKADYRFFTCDLTRKYIDINSCYTT